MTGGAPRAALAVVLAGVWAYGCACGGAAGRPAAPAASAAASSSAAPPELDELHERGDCPWVAEGCVMDEDGCSETTGHAPLLPGVGARAQALASCGTAAPFGQELADVVRELGEKPALTRVRIVAPVPACGDDVRSELVRVGVAPARIAQEVRAGARFVVFEVAAWNGADCPSPR